MDHTICDDLDIGKFEYEQTIAVPGGARSESFGLSISVGDSDETLLIGSGNSKTLQALIIDKAEDTTESTTTFDGNSTAFIDQIFGSNAYIYELFENKETHVSNTGLQIFAQKFDLIKNRRFDFFGLGLDLKTNILL